MRYLMVMLILYYMPLTSESAVVVISPPPPGEYSAIQPVIDAANNGDEIIFESGQYLLKQPVSVINKKLLIRSDSSAEDTSIQFSDETAGVGPVIIIKDRSSISISGLSFSRGAGGISIQTIYPVYISRCIMSFNTYSGLFIMNGGGPTMISNTLIHSNGKGIVSEGHRTFVSGCTLIANTGSAIHGLNNTTLDIWNCRLIANMDGKGAAIKCEEDAFAVVNNAIIAGNVSAYSPAIWCNGRGSGLIANSTIANNHCESPKQPCGGMKYLNCIFWDNEPPWVEGEVSGSLIDTNPSFVDEGKFDYPTQMVQSARRTAAWAGQPAGRRGRGKSRAETDYGQALTGPSQERLSEVGSAPQPG